MQVDHHQLYTQPSPSFDDYFKLDLLASDASSSSTSPSPRSPHPTSIIPDVAALAPSQDVDSLFQFYLQDEFSKDPMMGMGMSPLPPSINAPYDFLGAFNAITGSSLSTSPSQDSFNGFTPPDFSIDPLLVGTPSTPNPLSDFGGDEAQDEDPDDNNPDDDHDDLHSESLDIMTPIKVGGRGNKARKGTVASGGIIKKSSGPSPEKEKRPSISSVVSTGQKQDVSDMPDDWRPSPEEYKKMSSKEKRQLRNKISARNFRVRRKEYISTLEADISERDRLLAVIRTELGSTQSENNALRQEIAALKKALLDGRGSVPAPVLPPPAPLPSRAPTPPAPAPQLLTPNTQKDLPTSPRHSSSVRGFWGGVGMAGMGASGFTPVHTALIPDLGMPFGKKGSLMENLNPALNVLQSREQDKDKEREKISGFDGFADMNIFTLKSLDAYRMQLWGKIAAQYQWQQQLQHQQLQQQQQLGTQQQLTGLAAGLKPHYFQGHGANVGLSGVLSGKGVPNKPLGTITNLAGSTSSSPAQPTKEQAYLAALASDTLVRRLGGAFWDAFSGTPSPPSKASPSMWDPEKVRRVLEGKAVVRVVDVDAPLMSGSASPSPSSRSVPVSPRLGARASEKKEKEKEKEKDKCCVLTDILAESMGGLSLGKK